MLVRVLSAPVAEPQVESDEQIVPSLPAAPGDSDISDIISDILTVVPDPRDIPIIEYLSGVLYKCSDRYHYPIDIARAVRLGNTLRLAGKPLGFRQYPHTFHNREPIDFDDPGPYMEFPILRFGQLFTGGDPHADRVIFNAHDGSFVGVIMHAGSNGMFESCSPVPRELDPAIKPILKGAKGALEVAKPILKGANRALNVAKPILNGAGDVLDVAKPILQGDNVGAAKAVLKKVAKPILRGITGQDNEEALGEDDADENTETDANDVESIP